MQSELGKILPKPHFGLHRDDGLALMRNLNRQQTQQVRKNVIKIFKYIDTNLEIETNLKEIDFLDFTLDLQNGTHRLYKKPNDKLLYIHSLSNYPPNFVK